LMMNHLKPSRAATPVASLQSFIPRRFTMYSCKGLTVWSWRHCGSKALVIRGTLKRHLPLARRVLLKDGAKLVCLRNLS
jgi:hypothetical protein